MARASRKGRTSGRASVVGPSGAYPLPRTNVGVGTVVPRPTLTREQQFRLIRRINAAVGVPEVRVGRYKFRKVPIQELRREAARIAADRERKRAQWNRRYWYGLKFANPRFVYHCVKRKLRREVLFAFGQAGYSGSGPGRWNGVRRSYRRSAESGYSC